MWILAFLGSSFTLTRDDVLNLVDYVTSADYRIVNVATRVSAHVGAGLALTAEQASKVGA